jgi:hypothetical protein
MLAAQETMLHEVAPVIYHSCFDPSVWLSASHEDQSRIVSWLRQIEFCMFWSSGLGLKGKLLQFCGDCTFMTCKIRVLCFRPLAPRSLHWIGGSFNPSSLKSGIGYECLQHWCTCPSGERKQGNALVPLPFSEMSLRALSPKYPRLVGPVVFSVPVAKCLLQSVNAATRHCQELLSLYWGSAANSKKKKSKTFPVTGRGSL